MNNKQKTTIQITSKTRDHLKSLGKKGDSYDQIIKQLIIKGENKKMLKIEKGER